MDQIFSLKHLEGKRRAKTNGQMGISGNTTHTDTDTHVPGTELLCVCVHIGISCCFSILGLL